MFKLCKRRPFAALLICLLALLPGAALAGGDTLSILLTNDDGYDSAGIKALDTALREAGHKVTIVAPAGQRSGSGMQITLGSFALTEHAPGVWSVDASPADAVSVGLHHIMRDAPPDVVVSGANFGQNLGQNVMISGTVGAAMMAVLEGVPAIAISVGINLDEAASEPRFASTVTAFPGAAALTVRIIGALSRPGEGIALPREHMLNINYPARAPADLAGLRWTAVSRHGGFALIYPDLSDGKIRSWVEPDAAGIADSNADTGVFAAGYVTLSVLRPDWNGASTAADGLRRRLGALRLD